jgi:hypothetical protein
VGFVVSLPFQTSSFGAEIAANTGLPINAWAATLHYADIAFVVGFVVAFLIYWYAARSSAGQALTQDAAA